MKIQILSLFPDYFKGPFDLSIIGRAQEKGLVNIEHSNIRSFSKDKHGRVDDRTYGGGPGMVLSCQPLIDAIRAARKASSSPAKVIYMSPQGKLIDKDLLKDLSQQKDLILVAGHYEGIDERVIQKEVDEELSIGDYVLTNGCLASIVLVDAMLRFLPGVLGHEEAAKHDSFEEGIFDHPHYTRPSVFEGMEVPSVLLNGNHKEIEAWRKNQASEKTKNVRPELIGVG